MVRWKIKGGARAISLWGLLSVAMISLIAQMNAAGDYMLPFIWFGAMMANRGRSASLSLGRTASARR